MQIPALEDDRILRHVDVDGYRLLLWDTYRYASTGQCLLGYALYAPGASEPLFAGEDYGCAPGDAVDSDAAIRGLLGFLTLKPGDTDADYFADYTPEQLAFAGGPAESLSLWAMEDSTEPLVNLDDWQGTEDE